MFSLSIQFGKSELINLFCGITMEEAAQVIESTNAKGARFWKRRGGITYTLTEGSEA